jgi:hypothetical protein
MDKPSLIEPGMKSFLSHTLKQCKKHKENNQNIFYNIGFFVIFFLIIGGILLYKYKGKLTPYQTEQKEKNKQEYIVSKLQQMSYLKNKTNMITELPNWDNHPEAGILNRKIYQ